MSTKAPETNGLELGRMTNDKIRISRSRLFAVISVVVVLLGSSCRDSQRTEKRPSEKKDGNSEIRVVRYPNVDSIVSLVEILASPDKYDGNYVLVKGFFRNAFENVGVYLNRESAEYGITSNAIWVETSDARVGVDGDETLRDGMFDGTYVAIEGYYNKAELGHCGLFQGTLEAERIWELEREAVDARRESRERRPGAESGRSNTRSPRTIP